MRNGYDRGFLHRGMPDERVLQIYGTNPFSARLNQVLGAVGDLHVAFGVDGGHVSRSEPTVGGPPRRRSLFMVVITGGDEWAADFQFALSVVIPRDFARNLAAALADGANFGEWRWQSLARAGLKFAVVGPLVHMRLQGGYGHDGSGFGHAPGVDDTSSEFLEAAEKTF